MTHLFDEAFVERTEKGTYLCLRIQNAPMARQEAMQLRKGRTYAAEIKLHREKRSAKANAYAWVLMGKLASTLGMKRDDIYKSYIRDVGDNCKVVYIPDDSARASYRELWQAQGVGYLTDDTDDGCLICYYGSSSYDRAQMARLIDLIVQDCKDNDIETDTPEQLARYVEDWEAKM